MTNSRILRVLAVALGLTLAFGTAAFASDSVVADGDLLDGTFDVTNPGDTDPNDAAQFGDVCPGGTYQQNARLTIRRRNNQANDTFVNSAVVTWGFFPPTVTDDTPSDGAQEVAPAYGHLSAEYLGTVLPPVITMPSNWQTQVANNLYPPVASAIRGRVTLQVPVTAPAGDPNDASTSNGTVRWRANGTRLPDTDPLTVDDLAGANRPMGNNWTVLDGDAPACDKTASVTAAFAEPHVACANRVLTVTPVDPDGTVTTEDGLVIDIDWGADVPDSENVHLTGVKGNDPLTISAPYTAGPHTATVSWSDSHLDGSASTGTTTASTTIDYDTSGILQPINANGTSIFKSVSTIPVKVRFMDCDGSVPSNLAPTIVVAKISGTPPVAGLNEPALSTSAHTDGMLRFSEGQWIYNLSGKSLSDPSATYRLTITVPATGQTVVVGFALKA